MLTCAGEVVLTVIAMVLERAGLPVAHGALDVSCTLTWSPLARELLVNEGLLLPTGLPLISHWYAGDAPPLTGVAVKVTEVPEHISLEEAAILTETGAVELTVMVTMLDIAGLPVAQARSEVICTLTWSPLDSELLEKVALLLPTGLPLSSHW